MTEHISKKRPLPDQETNEIVCNKCNVSFKQKKHLYSHQRKFHQEDIISLGNMVCGMCKEKFRTMSKLHEHFSKVHDLPMKFETKSFHHEEEFESWKQEMEKETMSSYILRNRNTQDEETKISYYSCHRSGFYNFKTPRQRHPKARSIKCGNTCPAFIKCTVQVINDACEITVDHQSIHVGHDLDVGKLPLPKENRISLASSLKEELIMDEANQLLLSEKDALISMLQKTSDATKRQITVQNELKKLQRRMRGFQSVTILRHVEGQIKVINAYLDIAQASSNSTLVSLKKSAAATSPANKHIRKTKKIYLKEKSEK